MPVFVVTYRHPDSEGWALHLRPHIKWLQEQVQTGALLASGPLVGTPEKSALLIMSAESADALRALIETDPFWKEGLVHDMTVMEWDPIFGAFNAHSTMPAP